MQLPRTDSLLLIITLFSVSCGMEDPIVNSQHVADKIVRANTIQANPSTCPDTVFIGEHPSDSDDPNWTNNVQGLAHDDGHWFFTTETLLLKFPVDFDLATTIDTQAPPAGVQVSGPNPLGFLNYYHLGDPDQIGGFLFIAVEDGNEHDGIDVPPAIAVFRASDLSFIGLKVTVQTSAAWVAYNQHLKLLYSTDGNASS